MSLTGLHTACMLIGNGGPPGNAPLSGRLLWSVTQATPAATAYAAPDQGQANAFPSGSMIAFEFRSSVDAFVSYGPTPDAVNGPRIFIPAGETRNCQVQPSDKFAWVAA